MKHLSLIVLTLALAGCGGTRGRDPLSGLAGPSDPALYGFEADLQGWAKPADPSSTYQVLHAPGRSFFGSASLAMAVQSMGMVDSSHGRVSYVFPVPETGIAGRTITAWIYAPTGAQASESQPTYSQIYLKDAGGHYANGPGTNILINNWAQVVFTPVANPGATDLQVGGNYLGAGFDPSSINEIGIKVAASGAAVGFSFEGVFLIDSVSW